MSPHQFARAVFEICIIVVLVVGVTACFGSVVQ